MERTKMKRTDYNDVRRHQRFSIRKFNIGVASVMVGVGLYFGAASVMAEEVSADEIAEVAQAQAEEATEEDTTINTLGAGEESGTSELSETPIETGEVKNEDDETVGSYEKYTESDVDAPLDEANGASITEREVPDEVQDSNTANSDGYQKDQTEGRLTFGIQNLEDLNQVLEANGLTEKYYVTFSRSSTDASDTTVYANLVNKVTNVVVETKVLNVGDSNVTFSTLEQYIGLSQLNPRRLADYAEDDYSGRVNFDGSKTVSTTFMLSYTSTVQDNGTTTYYVNGDWTNSGSAWYYSNYVLSVTGGETPDTNALRSATQFYVPLIDAEQKTHYIEQSTGKELAEVTQKGTEGSTVTGAGEREFENYELVDKDVNTPGTLVGEYTPGTHVIMTGTGDNYENNVKVVSTYLDTEGTVRHDVYILDPSQEDYKNYRTEGVPNASQIVGYLAVSPDGNSALRTLLVSMTYDELINSEYFVLAADATDEQKLNPAIYKGYKYITSSDNLARDEAQEDALFTKDNVTFELQTRADGGTVTMVVYTQSADPVADSNGNVTLSGSNFRLSVLQGQLDETTGNTYKINTLWTGGQYGDTYTDENGETKNLNDTGFNFGIGSIRLFNTLQEVSDDYYYYLEKGGVEVRFVDEEGNEIKDYEVIAEHASSTDTYDTTTVKVTTIKTPDGKTYTFKEILNNTDKVVSDDVVSGETIKTIQNTTSETGNVTLSTLTRLTYVYTEVKGGVVVNYEDTEGNVIADQVIDTQDASTGTAYDTTDNKPTEITYNGHTYRLVAVAGDNWSEDGVKTGSASETGTVTETTQQVTYVYQLVKGNVIVNYEDEDGNVIQDPVVDEENTPVGDDYDTTDNRPEKITTPDGKTYERVPEKTEGDETGKVTEEDTEITYVYKEVKGNVNVHYVDTDGNTIAADVADTVNASTGTAYDTTDNKPTEIVFEGHTYRLTEQVIGEETGSVIEGTIDVTYVYELVKGNVIVNYEDEDGNVIKDPVVDEENTPVGDDYDTTDNKPETIEHDGHTYELVEEKTKGDETGEVVKGTTEVTYVYKLVTGDVIVHYQDTEGNTIAVDVTDTEDGDIGDAYDTTDNKPSTIVYEGQTYVLVPALTEGNETGEVVKGTTEVTYVYKLVQGNVIVHYQDTEGNTIANDVVDTENGAIDSAYDTTDNKPSEIEYDGHTYRITETVIGSETGSIIEGTIEVTYVYDLVKGNVIVHYEDENGNPIADDVIDEENTPVGDEYDTTDQKKDTIEKDGHTYYLVEEKTKGEETGEVTEEDTEVTYVYKLKGDVIVHYQDTEGNTIAADATDTELTWTGTSYDTSDDHKPATITYNGNLYVLVPASTVGNETGEVTEGTTEVTYVYQLVTGGVIVHYEDTEGNRIANDVVDTEDGAIDSDYDTTDNKPETIEYNGHTYRLTENVKGDETGTIIEGTIEVTYVYELVKGNVIVNYEDEDGNPIQDPVVDEENTPVGDDYDTTDNRPEKITTPDGKTYERVPEKTEGDETGKVTEEDTEITYVYKEVKGNVNVHYVDEDGNTIADDVVDTANASTGTAYDTTDHKPNTITFNGKTYYYKEVASNSASENGTVVEGTLDVTYVYRKMASWIPLIPGDNDPTDDTIDYPDPENPEDPQNPEVPITPDTPIPYVPGYTPVDPNGDPLQPVDPEDPTKGYLPPNPESPWEDTYIPYVKDGDPDGPKGEDPETPNTPKTPEAPEAPEVADPGQPVVGESVQTSVAGAGLSGITAMISALGAGLLASRKRRK